MNQLIFLLPSTRGYRRWMAPVLLLVISHIAYDYMPLLRVEVPRDAGVMAPFIYLMSAVADVGHWCLHLILVSVFSRWAVTAKTSLPVYINSVAMCVSIANGDLSQAWATGIMAGFCIYWLYGNPKEAGHGYPRDVWVRRFKATFAVRAALDESKDADILLAELERWPEHEEGLPPGCLPEWAIASPEDAAFQSESHWALTKEK